MRGLQVGVVFLGGGWVKPRGCSPPSWQAPFVMRFLRSRLMLHGWTDGWQTYGQTCNASFWYPTSTHERAPLKIAQGHTPILKTAFDGKADCRRRNMKQSRQDKGRGEGRNSSARWHRLLCNWAPKLFIHQPPCRQGGCVFSSPPTPSAALTDQEC